MTDEPTSTADLVVDVDVDVDAPADLVEMSDDIAVAATEFLATCEGVAAAQDADHTVSLLLLALPALLAAAAPLGAIVDVVPEGKFEPDAGYDVDVDRLREALHALLGPADDYAEVFDPYAAPEVVPARLSDDLADICSDLLHGLAHHRTGRILEALWWWQFSYLSTWGPAASAALRALQSLVAHVRLDLPLEVSTDEAG